MSADDILTPEDRGLVRDIRVRVAQALANGQDSQAIVDELTGRLVEHGWPGDLASTMVTAFISEDASPP